MGKVIPGIVLPYLTIGFACFGVYQYDTRNISIQLNWESVRCRVADYEEKEGKEECRVADYEEKAGISGNILP